MHMRLEYREEIMRVRVKAMRERPDTSLCNYCITSHHCYMEVKEKPDRSQLQEEEVKEVGDSDLLVFLDTLTNKESDTATLIKGCPASYGCGLAL